MHKSKSSLNLKIIILLFALVAAVGIAFSAIQAFATSQDAAQANETVDVTFTSLDAEYGHIVLKDQQ